MFYALEISLFVVLPKFKRFARIGLRQEACRVNGVSC